MAVSNVGYNPFGNTLPAYINEAIKKAVKELQTCIPAIVKEVKGRNQVVVSPAIQQTSAGWQTLPWADIVLPVYAPQGKEGIISMPVSAGDTGWIIAGDLDPSLYFKNPKSPAKQNVFDRHNYQYGFFIPCKFGDFGIEDTDSGGIVIKNGNTKIVIKENEIDIVSNNELKINANSVSITSSGNSITIDGVNFANHTHTVPKNIPVNVGGETGVTTSTATTSGVN